MLGNLNGWHLLIVLAVILLLFGATKLPALAKSVGQSARVFRTEMKEMTRDDEVSASSPETPRATDAGTASSVTPENRASNDTTP